jgi:hypothetical protein
MKLCKRADKTLPPEAGKAHNLKVYIIYLIRRYAFGPITSPPKDIE